MLNHKKVKHIFENFSADTLTLYLRVDPSDRENQAQKPAWNIWLKNALRDIENQLQPEQESLWSNIAERLDNHFSVYEPGGRTLVMFMDEDQEFIRELPFAMDNYAHFGTPMVTPLLWVIDEYEQYLIVTVDSERAMFRQAYLGNMETESEMTIDLAYDWGEKTLMPASAGDGRALRQGNNRESFNDMIEDHIRRFHKDVADEIQNIFREHQPMRLILGGDERAAHAVQGLLHESVQEHFVTYLPIPMDADETAIMKKIGQPAYDYERNYEYDLVNDVINRAKADGRGVLGRDDLERAMQMQQVEMIILPYRLLDDDPDYVHELTIWTIENNSQIEFVHGQAATQLDNEGGIAARLYYAIETA